MINRSSDLSNTTSRRAQLLASAGTAVLVALSAVPAQAADILVQTNPNTTQVVGGLTNTLSVINVGDVQAAVQNTDGTIGSGSSIGASNNVTFNSAVAKAIGNTTGNTINQTSILAGPVNGIAAATLATNSGVISSAAQNNALTIEIGAISSGSATNDGNTISAETTANRSLTAVNAAVPAGLPAASPGSTTFDVPSLGFDSSADASGDIVATSVQVNSQPGTAAVTGNRVGLDLGLDLAADPVSIGATLDANTISAVYKANSANTAAAVTAAGLPNFDGSIVVTNAQTNVAGGQVFAPTNASNLGSLIDAHVGYDVAAFPGNGASLQGSLSISDNSVTAAATGNEAIGTGAAGNRIVIADGKSVKGAGGLLPGSSAVVSGSDASLAANADLVVLSSQSNAGTDLSAFTEGGSILADVRSLVGGTVAVGDNSFGAAATGNLASNAVLTGSGAATFDATVAILNHQANTNGGASAQSSENTAVVTVGRVDANDPDATSHLLDHANVSLIGNADRAAAYGNSSTQRVAVDATTVVPSGTNFAFGANGDVQGGITVSNRQLNTNAPTSAEVSESMVLAQSLVDNTLDSQVLFLPTRKRPSPLPTRRPTAFL